MVMKYSMGLVLKQPQKYSNLHSNLTLFIDFWQARSQKTRHNSIYNHYSCTEAARSMARSTIQLLFESWPSSTCFFKSKGNLKHSWNNYMLNQKTMWQSDLSKPFSHVNWNHLSSHSFTASQRAELQSISLTSHPDRSAREKRVRKKVSSAMDSGVSRQRKNVNVKLPKEKWWKHTWSFFLWKTLKNIDVLEICLYWLWNMIGRYSTTEVWWGKDFARTLRAVFLLELLSSVPESP